MIEYTVKVYKSGNKEWYLNGQRHREDGPAIEWISGYKEWWVNGKLHREDGPAVEDIRGDEEWWVNGKLHREDGPAVYRSNGYKEWWVNGREVTEQEVMGKSLIGKTVTIDGVKYVLGEY